MTDDRTSLTLLGHLRSEDNDPAWTQFAEIYGPLMSGWLKRRGVPEDVAEDVRQDVLVKVFNEIRDFTHNGRTGAFRAWLRLVMMHRLRTIQRRNFRPGEAPSLEWSVVVDQLEDENSEMSRQWDADHDRHLIKRLLEIVAPEFQEKSMVAFRRVVLQGEDAAVVAEELGLTVNAVRIAQSRILAALRRVGEGFID